MFHTFHVSEDIHSISLVESAIHAIAVRRTGRRCLAISRLQKKDVGPGIFGTEIDMVEHARSDSSFGAVKYQTWVNVDNCRTLNY